MEMINRAMYRLFFMKKFCMARRIPEEQSWAWEEARVAYESITLPDHPIETRITEVPDYDVVHRPAFEKVPVSRSRMLIPYAKRIHTGLILGI